jgi:hypothetical protein
VAPVDDPGLPISYKLLERGTPIVSADGVEVGVAERAIDNVKEQIFDGIVMRAGDRHVWVDAPEVARIYEREVVLTIDAAAAAELGDYEPGAPEFRADARVGRLGRFFGGGWKRG